MKNFKLFALTAVLGGCAFLTSCGNGGATGSSAPSGALLGRTPAIFVEVASEKQSMEKSLRAANSVEEHQEILKNFEEYVALSSQNAEKEAQKVIGTEIPHSGDEAYDEFEIREIKVTDYEAGKGTGSFVVRVKVASKYGMMVQNRQSNCGEGEYSLVDTRMYYVCLSKDDHFISLGELNPFNGKNYLQSLKADYKAGDTLSGGDLCNAEGAPIMINCHTYDYTNLGKIHFLSEQDYRNMRRQAYGF